MAETLDIEHAKESILTSSGRIHEFPLSILLIIPVAFFASWGSGLQKIAEFDISKVFVGCALLLIVYWALFSRRKFRVFPKVYNYYIFFLFVHILITYALFFPAEFALGYTGEKVYRGTGAYILRGESVGIKVFRFVLFVFLGYALAAYFTSRRIIITFTFAYSAGLISATILGGHAFIWSGGTIVQQSGGFLNPNTLGPAALTSFWLGLFVFFTKDAYKWIRTAGMVIAVLSVLIVFSTVARGSILALFVGLLCFVYYLPGVARKFTLSFLLILLTMVSYLFIPDSTMESLRARADLGEIKETGGSLRLSIWSEYLKEMPRYALAGVGKERSTVVIQESLLIPTWKVTHNSYLEMWVEFGFFGIVLFMMSLYNMWRRISFIRSDTKHHIHDAVMLGLLSSYLVVFMFENALANRTTWLTFAVIGAYGFLRYTYKEKERQ